LNVLVHGADVLDLQQTDGFEHCRKHRFHIGIVNRAEISNQHTDREFDVRLIVGLAFHSSNQIVKEEADELLGGVGLGLGGNNRIDEGSIVLLSGMGVGHDGHDIHHKKGL